MIDAWFIPAVDLAVRMMEMIGILIILAGAIAALGRYLWQWFRTSASGWSDLRTRLGRAILLGLEFLIAADIINTVAIEPSLDSVLVLGGIVLIRTFLSLSLDVELEGAWPWQRAERNRRRS